MVASLKYPSRFRGIVEARKFVRDSIFDKACQKKLKNGARRAAIEALAYLYLERPTTFSRRLVGALKRNIEKRRKDKFDYEDFLEGLRFLHSIKKIILVEEDGEDGLVLEYGCTEINHCILLSKNLKTRGRRCHP